MSSSFGAVSAGVADMSKCAAIVAGAGGELGRATAEVLAHAVAPEVADTIGYLVSDAAGPVSGAVVPARSA